MHCNFNDQFHTVLEKKRCDFGGSKLVLEDNTDTKAIKLSLRNVQLAEDDGEWRLIVDPYIRGDQFNDEIWILRAELPPLLKGLEVPVMASQSTGEEKKKLLTAINFTAACFKIVCL